MPEDVYNSQAKTHTYAYTHTHPNTHTHTPIYVYTHENSTQPVEGLRASVSFFVTRIREKPYLHRHRTTSHHRTRQAYFFFPLPWQANTTDGSYIHSAELQTVVREVEVVGCHPERPSPDVPFTAHLNMMPSSFIAHHKRIFVFSLQPFCCVTYIYVRVDAMMMRRYGINENGFISASRAAVCHTPQTHHTTVRTTQYTSEVGIDMRRHFAKGNDRVGIFPL